MLYFGKKFTKRVLEKYNPKKIIIYSRDEYKQFFDIKEGDSIGFATNIDDEFTDFFKNNFTKKQRKEIRKNFPELTIK